LFTKKKEKQTTIQANNLEAEEPPHEVHRPF